MLFLVCAIASQIFYLTLPKVIEPIELVCVELFRTSEPWKYWQDIRVQEREWEGEKWSWKELNVKDEENLCHSWKTPILLL